MLVQEFMCIAAIMLLLIAAVMLMSVAAQKPYNNMANSARENWGMALRDPVYVSMWVIGAAMGLNIALLGMLTGVAQ